jgi:hypothetical protein
VLELSLREGLSLGHNYIGTEHILLGLARENEGVAARILLDFDVDAERLRNEVVRTLSGPARKQSNEEEYTEVFPQDIDLHLGYSPQSPPIAPEVGEELARVRRDIEEAIKEQRFPEAAELRDRERRLSKAAKRLERAWFRHENGDTDFDEEFSYSPGARRVVDYGAFDYRRYFFLLGFALFGVASAVGLFVGWLIWG